MPENEEEPEHAPEFDEAMMKTGHDGLSEKEAAMRLKMYGRNELPDMRMTVDALDLSESRVDYLGWFEGNIQDLINARERTTRCKRCSDHVDRWWSGNEAFEREVARLFLQTHGGNADVAAYAVSPELFESDCVLPYFDAGVETRVIRHIRELAM